MKKPNTFTARLGSLLLLLSLLTTSMGKAYGQLGFISPLFLDKPLYSAILAPPPPFENTASIDYQPFRHNNPGPWQLTAIVADGSMPSYSATLYVTDNYYTSWVSLPIYSGTALVYPDCAIGNDLANNSQYIIGVVVNISSDIYLYTYSVSNQGASTVTPFGLVLDSVTNLSNTGTVVGVPHIDIIAEYDNLYPTFPPTGQKPFCNKFVATWQDASAGIMGCYGILSTPSASTVTVIDGSPTASRPACAGVGRIPCTSANEYWGLFTYLDSPISVAPYYNLMEAEKCFNYSYSVAPTVYDIDDYTLGGSVPTLLNCPRIAAIDDYHKNNPGPGVYPGIGCSTPAANTAYFTIAIGGMGYGSYNSIYPPASGTSYLLEYNNLLGAYNYILPTGFGLDITYQQLAQLNYTPTIACGPDVHYTIQYSSEGTLYTYPQVFAETTDWGTGTTSPGTISPYIADLYQVAYSANTGIIGNGANAISGTCNTQGPAGMTSNVQQIFSCWDGTAYGPYTVYYKTASLNGSNPWIEFRQGPTGLTNIGQDKNWLVSPNPAADYIVITSPADMNSSGNSSCLITDITGREMLRANISQQSQQINTGGLVPGVYLLHIYKGNNEMEVDKFVKE